MNIIDKINQKQINPNIPEFCVGDTVRIVVKNIEQKRERIQAFGGQLLISMEVVLVIYNW